MCLLSIALYSQQPPKTPAELEAFMKSLQKKSDSMQNAMKNKTVGNSNATGGISQTAKTPTAKTIEDQKLPELDSAKAGSLPKKFSALQNLILISIIFIMN